MNSGLRLGGSAERPKRRENPSFSSSAGGVYRGSKRTCTERARWRLVRGQPAQRLSVHYQLECDYGTSTLTIYNDGDAVFLCEGHLSAIQSPQDNCIAGVRAVELNPAAGENSLVGAESPEVTETPEGLSEAASISSSDNPPSSAGGVLTDAVQSAVVMPDAPTVSGELVAEVQKPNTSVAADGPATGAVRADGSAGKADSPTTISQTQEEQPVAAPENAAAPATPSPSEAVVAARPRRGLAIPTARSAVRDLAYGNSAKALVDETIWNMAPGDVQAYRSALERGKTAQEAAQAAGGQLEVVHRKIAEYTAKIEPILSASQATISVGYGIDKPLEQAILEIIGSDALVETEKDAAVGNLGEFQREIKRGLESVISPLEAYRIARQIGERANWGAHSEVPEELKKAYRAVYARLRDALRAFVPEAREMEERLANLYVARSDIETVPPSKNVRSAAD